MKNLAAASLDLGIASKLSSDGLLGIPFFSSFPAGVEFDFFGTGKNGLLFCS